MQARWIRVFYRDGKNQAFTEGPELDRILARKVPRVIHQEVALIHRCQACGVEGPWTENWRAYAILSHHPQWSGVDGMHIACSDLCYATFGIGEFPDWLKRQRYHAHAEPNRPTELNQAYWHASRAENERKAELLAFRKVPMPEWLGDGFCKWCNAAMTEADKPARMWHRRCSREFLLATDLSVQQRALIKRDGPGCAMPGCTNRGGEVDHKRPLWSVRHLPPMMRRVFYMPGNLWLLCRTCHAAKTKREAAERAAQRREGK